MGLTKEDRILINELYDKYNKGQRINSELLTSLYNRVFNKNEKNVNCSTCLRHRLFDLVNILNETIALYSKNLSKSDIEFLRWSKTLEEGHYPSFDRVIEIYNKAFSLNQKPTNCLRCINTMLSDLYELLGNI